MAKKTFRNHHNTTLKDFPGQKFTQKSKTVPGRAILPSQVMKRFESGRSVTALPSYFETDYMGNGNVMPDFESMDLVDLQEFHKRNDERVKKLREIVENQQKADAEANKKKLEQEQKLLDMLKEHMEKRQGTITDIEPV